MTRSSDRRAGRAVAVETAQGPARVTLDEPVRRPRATLVLGHGAGGGVDGPDMTALTGAAVARGLRVARVEQPWRVAGKRIAPAPARLDAAWYEILEALGGVLAKAPVVLGGRSAGARVACRTAGRVRAVAVIAMAFPLHPPGRPERSRVDELLSAGVPVFVVQGERDAFGRPEEFPSDLPMHVVTAADHGFAVPAAYAAERDRLLLEAVNTALTWCDIVVKPQE